MSNDRDWERIKTGVVRLALQLALSPTSNNESVLGIKFGTAMRRKQNLNLISHVYEHIGVRAHQISGGKFELQKRHKLFG